MWLWELANLKSVGQVSQLEAQIQVDIVVLSLKSRGQKETQAEINASVLREISFSPGNLSFHGSLPGG